MSGQVWALPDSVVAQAAEDFGFTPGANPSFSAPVDPLTLVDTAISTIDGVTYENIYNYGDLGQPLLISVTRAGALFTKTRYVWASLSSGGVQLSSVIVEDYSQPEVLVRTTATLVSGRVVILTADDRSRPVLGSLGLKEATAIGLPVIHLPPIAEGCINRLGKLLLPQALQAQQLSPCADAWWGFAEHIGGLLGASVYLVAAPSPWSVAVYFGVVSKLVHQTFKVGAACSKKK